MTRLKHYDNLGTARFVTLSCYHNYNLLRTDFGAFVKSCVNCFFKQRAFPSDYSLLL